MLISMIIIASALISVILILLPFTELALGYEYLWLLPMTFIFTYTFCYQFLIKNKNMKITVYILIFYSWLRCVLIPLIGSYSGYYSGNDSIGILGSNNTIQTATHLIAYEQIFIGIFLTLFASIKAKETFKKTSVKKSLATNLQLKGNKNIYLIYILFSAAVFLVLGRNLDLFQFFLISTDEEVRRGDIVNSNEIMIRQIISTGMLFTFFLIIERCRKLYSLRNKDMYINLALVAALILISIIMGERRSTQVYLAFSTAWLLINIFPHKRKKVVYTISATALSILTLMSIYKFYNAFLYGSYVDAVTRIDFSLSGITTMIDSYFYGIKALSSNIGFSEISNTSFINLIFDLFSSIFGLGSLINNGMVTTSEIYNLTIYNGSQSSGYLFSSLGYGYLYFGYFLAPLITIFNIYLALKLEELMKRAKSIEMNFIISYIFIRFGFGIFGNPIPLINSGTRYFILNGLVFLIAFLLASRTVKKNSYNESIKGVIR